MSKKVSIKDRAFGVVARIVSIVEVEIEASSFEEAVEKSKALKENYFITVEGENIDSSIRIVTIQKQGAWRTDDYN